MGTSYAGITVLCTALGAGASCSKPPITDIYCAFYIPLWIDNISIWESLGSDMERGQRETRVMELDAQDAMQNDSLANMPPSRDWLGGLTWRGPIG